MPTTSTKTIKSSGGDYTTLSAWEAAQEADLVANDRIAEAACYNFACTDQVTINGWTTDATRYIRIYTPPGERHNGTASTGFSLANPTEMIRLVSAHVRIEGLIIKATASAASGTGIIDVGGTANADYRVSHCVIVSTTETSSGSGIDFNGSNATSTVRIWNNIVYGFGATDSSPGYGIGVSSTTCTAYIYNNTAYLCRYGFVTNSTNHLLKNNIGDTCASGGYTGTTSASSTKNLSSAADAPGTSPQNSKNPTYVNEAGRDFHLGAADTVCKDLGVDASDANITFSDDIDGATRTSGTWDIGADEIAAAAPSNWGRMLGGELNRLVRRI